MTRRRLDAELVRRGLSPSRAEARTAVQAGLVRIAGSPASKVETLVSDEEPVEMAGPPGRYVSRGGDKLDAAMERFGLDPSGRSCLDAGASTGGFTDRLLQAGARHVVAVDVGYGQMAWRLRRDPRVTILDRTNVRELTVSSLPYRPDLVVADLSFISLRSVLAALSGIAAEESDAVLLVKPQFEAEPAQVPRGGVVRDPVVWASVLGSVIGASGDAGFAPQGLMASPVRGRAGNVEFLLWARRGAEALDVDVDAAIVEGRALAAPG